MWFRWLWLEGEAEMLKVFKNISFFQKAKGSQKSQNPDVGTSNESKPKQKTMRPHSNDMCCGNCGGSRKEK